MTAKTGRLIGGEDCTEVIKRGTDATQKIPCLKWAETLLRKKHFLHLTREGKCCRFLPRRAEKFNHF